MKNVKNTNEMIKWMNENLKSMWELVDYNDIMITIEIIWGDWKHDHMRTKWLMEQEGWMKVDSYTTEEDGSDCYSAQHRFVKGI